MTRRQSRRKRRRGKGRELRIQTSDAISRLDGGVAGDFPAEEEGLARGCRVEGHPRDPLSARRCRRSVFSFAWPGGRNAWEYFTDARVPGWHRDNSVGSELRYISWTSRYVVYRAGFKSRVARRYANVSYAIREGEREGENRRWKKEVSCRLRLRGLDGWRRI